jgi:hypothetical protein
MSGSHQQHHAAPHANGANVSMKLSASRRAAQPGEIRKNKSQGRRVRIEQTVNGMWEVRDQSYLRGGLFRDYRSAAYFIKHEYHLAPPSHVIVNGGKSMRGEPV